MPSMLHVYSDLGGWGLIEIDMEKIAVALP
jgi:hypothetical protein